jgi:hypothetical protein
MRSRGVKLPPSRRRRPGTVRADRPGEVMRCLLLAGGPEWVAVDVASGALVRSHASGWPASGAEDGSEASEAAGVFHGAQAEVTPELDVVVIELASDDEPVDPARPEAVMLSRAPARVGTPRRRAVRRILQELLPADPKRPLLGSLGPSISYEDLDGSRPSVAIVAPDRTPVFASDAKGTWCQFGLGGRKHQLPVVDKRILGARSETRGAALGTEAIARAIGGSPRYLVVGLGAPHRGQAPKLVLGVLPRP